MSISLNFGGSVELSHNMLYMHGLSKECNSGVAEYINMEFSENERERIS